MHVLLSVGLEDDHVPTGLQVQVVQRGLERELPPIDRGGQRA